MIFPTGPVRVLVATKPVDFRPTPCGLPHGDPGKGMDGLAALAKEELKAEPFSGVVIVFRAKRGDRLKLLVWDGTGLVLVSKRLDDGKFRWPRIADGVMRLTPAQFSELRECEAWQRVVADQGYCDPGW